MESSGFYVDKEKTSILINKPESKKRSGLEANLQTTKRSRLDSDSSSSYSGGLSSPDEDGVETASGPGRDFLRVQVNICSEYR